MRRKSIAPFGPTSDTWQLRAHFLQHPGAIELIESIPEVRLEDGCAGIGGRPVMPLPNRMDCDFGAHRNGNPYHNNLHATDVLQTTHWLISQTGVKDWLTDIEIFALLFSAIIHDYDHSGTTNNFHIQSNSSLAFMYNDRSVLENHHVAAFFRTMQDNDCFILGNMSMAEFREFRSLMIEMVLHTGEC